MTIGSMLPVSTPQLLLKNGVCVCRNHGEYAAFGEVADKDSMQVVLDMSVVKTHSVGYFDDVPVEPIIIKNVEIVEE